MKFENKIKFPLSIFLLFLLSLVVEQKQAWSFELEGSRGRGRPKLDWKTMMEKDCCKVGVKFLDAKDRAKWRCCAKSWKESQ